VAKNLLAVNTEDVGPYVNRCGAGRIMTARPQH
jgi:hypothetical protein